MDPHPLPADLEDRLRQEVEACGLAELWPRLRPLARPCYLAELVPDADLGQLGTSRLGGLPDLPAGLAWPEREGLLLTFIGQINLAEVPRLPVPLPEKGMLAFFLGEDEPASHITHEVLFWEGGKLVRQEEPDEDVFLNEDDFKPAGVRWVHSVSLPDDIPDLSPDVYGDRLEELHGRLGSPHSPRKSSQLLGHAHAVCGDPLAEAYVAVHGHADILYALDKTPSEADRDLDRAAAEGDADRVEWLQRRNASLAWFHGSREQHRREIEHWQLLLEVASHRACGMCWWDAGRLQFLIDTRDLRARDFSRTYACIQTS